LHLGFFREEEDRLVCDVLGDHGLAEALRRDEDDATRRPEEVETDSGLHEGAIDLRRPVPVLVGDRLEATEVASRQTRLEASPAALPLLDVGEMLEELGGASDGCSSRSWLLISSLASTSAA